MDWTNKLALSSAETAAAAVNEEQSDEFDAGLPSGLAAGAIVAVAAIYALN